ncbi:LysE family translocator [uncultured Thalassospira sp.]|uniref:LysE family translocator n=1 Tax=uncultured Thalassospira sp. TaxID=404382 RepID=UPI0025933799|nr:LysE family translocator [uncultured Thalassospira sp.]|tara:strand:+ start:1730 stop:2344 length:615 start_codon:yes stop_codon:yes gene_type:complete
MITLDYLITSLIIVALPGTGVIYTLALGLGRGMKASIWAAFGCTLGIVPHMAASILGLSALLHASAVAFEIVRYLGVAWLLYMAWGMWFGTGAMKVTANETKTGIAKIIRDGILLNLLNPKLSVFFLAFLPQFVTADTPDTTAEMTLLGLIFMAMTFGVFVIYGCFAAALRQHVLERKDVMAWIGKSFATAFIAVGLKLLLTNQ